MEAWSTLVPSVIYEKCPYRFMLKNNGTDTTLPLIMNYDILFINLLQMHQS